VNASTSGNVFTDVYWNTFGARTSILTLGVHSPPVETIVPTPPTAFLTLVKSCLAPPTCITASQAPATDITYGISATNTGGHASAQVVITDPIPPNMDFKLGTASATFPAMVSVPLPLYRQHTAAPYWLRVLPSQQAVYLKYNQCVSGPGFGQLAGRVLAILRAHPGYRLIVDLRDNSGGDTQPFQSLIDGLLADPAIDRAGRIFGLINGQTDSSAGLDASDLSTQVHGLLVGQQIADPIDEYGNSSGRLRLPYGGVQVSYTTAVVNPASNHYGSPAVSVAPTLPDVLDGSDPVLAAALSFGHKT